MIRKISTLSEKLELTTNTSRILTLDKNIPRVQVNNPELLAGQVDCNRPVVRLIGVTFGKFRT